MQNFVAARINLFVGPTSRRIRAKINNVGIIIRKKEFLINFELEIYIRDESGARSKPASEKQIDIDGRALTKHKIANVCLEFSRTRKMTIIVRILF